MFYLHSLDVSFSPSEEIFLMKQQHFKMFGKQLNKSEDVLPVVCCTGIIASKVFYFFSPSPTGRIDGLPKKCSLACVMSCLRDCATENKT